MAARLRPTRFRVGEADASQILPPPLPLYQIPADTRVARTGVPEERPMHLPVRRHLAYLRGERPPPTPVLVENRSAIETEVRENSERAVLSRVVVYEYNHPEAVERPDDSLEFDSLFESGNLLRAERIVRAPAPGQAKRQEYELLIHPDVRNGAYRQWFYFEVRNGKPGVEYRFSFANLAKSGALFGAGLQPVVYSEKEAEARDVGWVHAGFHVRYGPSCSIDGAPPNNELSFHYRFAHADDCVYFACIQPYTYTDLVEYLERLEGDPQRAATLRRTELCQTIAENTCDLLTITSPPAAGVQPEDRQIIVLSARVHPGEPNSSWMMKGMLDYLTGSSAGAAVLRRHFVFKIVPMLNPDGVVNGNTRVNLAGWDLNRKWASPIEKMFPTIFHLKRLLANYQSRGRVAVYCDLHGHSLSRNIFTYGCYSRKTGAATTTTAGIKSDPRVLPMIVARNSPLFSFASCDFKVHKSKLSTARVVVHRELGVVNSYTLEASFCGPNFGPRKDTQFSTWDLEDMGRSWCQSLLVYFGLVAEVKALEAERGRELQQSEAAASASRVDCTTQNESEDEGVGEGETRPLDLLSNALDDIEAAITELFAQTQLEDTDAARGGGADLSDAEEEPAPPDASLAAVGGDSDGAGDQERSRKKKVRRRKRPRGRSKSTKKGEGRKKREDGKPKAKKKTKAKRKASVERAPRADSDKDDSEERQPRARRTSTNRRRSRSRSRAARAAAKAFIDHDANPVGISVSARDAETSGGADRGVRVLPSVLDLPTTTERRLRTAPANCREDERRRQSLGRVSSGARLELPALVGPDAKAAALRPAAADSESEPPSDDDEEDSDESEQSEPAEAYGSDF